MRILIISILAVFLAAPSFAKDYSDVPVEKLQKTLETDANNGDLKAVEFLGTFHLFGSEQLHIPQDTEKSIYWFTRLCEEKGPVPDKVDQGKACYRVAQAHKGEQIKNANPDLAIKYFLRAAKFHDPDSALLAAKMLIARDAPGDAKQAFELLTMILQDNYITFYMFHDESSKDAELFWAAMLFKGVGTPADRPRAYAALALVKDEKRVRTKVVRQALKAMRFRMSRAEYAQAREMLQQATKPRDLIR